MKVEGECISCGTCVEVCLAGNMELREGGAYVGENCKGCGRCVEMCPQQAITMTFDHNMDAVNLILEKYENRTDIGPLTGKP